MGDALVVALEVFQPVSNCPGAGNVGTIQGSGQGLAIVENAAEMHGGTIAVESRFGAGTVFAVRLPTSDPARPS